MEVADEYAYAVVQFLEEPYADIGDYTCVPHSWIRSRRATHRKSMVAYPDESPSITENRIKNRSKPSKRWKNYMAIIKHEAYTHEDAYKFIMEKLHKASTNSYSTVVSTDYKRVPATETKENSRILKRSNLLDPQPKKNKNKLKIARLGDTISNLSMSSKHPNVESTSLVPPEETGRREYQEEIPRDVRPRYDDILHRYPHFQPLPQTVSETQANSSGAASQSNTGRTLYASRSPLNFVKQIIDDCQLPQEYQLSSNDLLHDVALTHGMQNEWIPNLQTFLHDISKPLTRNPNIESNTLSIIQDHQNIAKQFSHLDIPKSAQVNKDHPQVSVIQETPGHSSKVECAISTPSFHRKMANASYASVGGLNLAEHQGPSIEKIVVDEPSEVSCVEQCDLPGRRAENESSVVPNSSENANYSGQSAVRAMGEDLPINEEVTLSDESTQDIDNDERSSSPELSAEKILTVTPNSYERINQLVDTELVKADVLVDQLYDLFQRMKVDFSQTCEIASDMHKSFVESHKVIECIANASKNLRESTKAKIKSVTSKKGEETPEEVQEMSEENKTPTKERGKREKEDTPDVNMEENMMDDNDEGSKMSKNNDDVVLDDKDEERHDEVPKTTRGHIRTFLLPPEYDPDDTRWTLKHREQDPKRNLVELVPHSNVFIDSIKLAHCKRVSKDSKALARMLLVEIYSLIALSVCSLTGARANAFDISGTNVRPGLDETARIAILTYAEEHAVKKKWAPFDSQSVINSLRSKIQDIRAKHGKTA